MGLSISNSILSCFLVNKSLFVGQMKKAEMVFLEGGYCFVLHRGTYKEKGENGAVATAGMMSSLGPSWVY